MLVLVLLSLRPLPSNASDPSPAKDYVHIKLVPEFIQDLPNLKPGSPPPTPVEIATSKFKVELDLYFLPDARNSPAFIVGSFNVQRENQEWVTIVAEHRITNLMSSESFNKIETASQARTAGDVQFQPSFTPFSPDQMVFTVMSSPPVIETESRKNMQPYMMLMVALPTKEFLSPEEPFPFELYLRYGLPSARNRKLSIRYKKFITGNASIRQLDMLDLQTIEQLLANSSCERSLGKTLH